MKDAYIGEKHEVANYSKDGERCSWFIIPRVSRYKGGIMEVMTGTVEWCAAKAAELMRTRQVRWVKVTLDESSFKGLMATIQWEWR